MQVEARKVDWCAPKGLAKGRIGSHLPSMNAISEIYPERHETAVGAAGSTFLTLLCNVDIDLWVIDNGAWIFE